MKITDIKITPINNDKKYLAWVNLEFDDENFKIYCIRIIKTASGRETVEISNHYPIDSKLKGKIKREIMEKWRSTIKIDIPTNKTPKHFNGFVIVDPDGKPMFETFLECKTSKECEEKYMTDMFGSTDGFHFAVNNGYSCRELTAQLKE